MKRGKNLIVLVVILFIFWVLPVRAATFLLDAPETVLVGDTIEVVLYLDTEGENINSLGSLLLFPEELFKFKSISDGDSIVSLWVEKPRLIGDGVISFAGVIPGGFGGLLSAAYQGTKPGKVLGVQFEVINVGKGVFSLQQARVLRHDGLGTETQVNLQKVDIQINEGGGQINTPVSTVDNDPPEEFLISLAQSSELFSNQWFVAFVTQDKGSGVDYYEVQETRNSSPSGAWMVAESPYLLSDQSLKNNIFVRAVDKKGNIRLATLMSTGNLFWWQSHIIWVIIILAVVSIIIIAWRKWWNKIK